MDSSGVRQNARRIHIERRSTGGRHMDEEGIRHTKKGRSGCDLFRIPKYAAALGVMEKPVEVVDDLVRWRRAYDDAKMKTFTTRKFQVGVTGKDKKLLDTPTYKFKPREFVPKIPECIEIPAAMYKDPHHILEYLATNPGHVIKTATK